MSKYWDPAWEKPTYVATYLRPDRQTIEGMPIETPEGWEDAPPTQVCWDNGRLRLASFGPDTILLVPAPHRAITAGLQKEIGALNYYFVCTRPRIRASDCTLSADRLTFRFEVMHDDGSVEVLHRELPAPPKLISVKTTNAGSGLEYTLVDGVSQIDSALAAQTLFRRQPYEPSFLDLDVRYIGRARGVVKETCALDRLESHPKYQAVMEEVLASPHRNRDVWLVLGAGTTLDIMAIGFGDGVPDPGDEAILAEAHRARSILSKSRRIDVTEALLINYFKPPHNEQHTGTLNVDSKTFKHCREANLTGLMLAMPTTDWGVALYTDHVVPSLWNVMTTCLDGAAPETLVGS